MSSVRGRCQEAGNHDAPPLSCPDEGGLAWRELTTRHFVLRTDLPEDCATAAATELEQTYASLRDIAFPYDIEPTGRITATFFAREKDYHALGAPTVVAGWFRDGRNAWDEHTQAVTSFSDINEVRSIFRHELTHRFVHFYYAQAPIWLNEGLATYWETLDVRGGMAWLGRPTTPRAFGPTRWMGRLPATQDSWHHFAITADELPGIQELRGAKVVQFYGLDLGGHDAGGVRKVRNYIAAGSMVSWLRTGPYAARFQAYLHGLGKARSDEQAWRQAFAGVDPATIDAGWRKALDTPVDTVQRTPYEFPPVPAPTHRLMSDAEVHLTWIKARFGDRGKQALRLDLADIDEAVRSAPNDPQVIFARAGLKLAAGRLDEAAADIERALAARPGETRFLEGMLSLRYRQDLETAQPRWDRVEELAAQVRARRDASWNALNTAAWISALRSRPAEGLPLAIESIERQPGCGHCYDTLAALLYQKGDLEGALGSQQRATSLAREGRVDREALKRLRFYEEAWRARAAAERAGASWVAPPLRLAR
jgi:tetratricopeptide (TPR) repeat protein